MIYTINKGKHRPSFLQSIRQFGLFWGEKMVRKVCFYIDCKYDLAGIEDDGDVNKLFGFGFFPGHHKHSARFGWFFDNDSRQIVLMAYCYLKGKRISEKICELMLNRVYHLQIDNDVNAYKFTVKDEDLQLLAFSKIYHDNKARHLGFKLGLFFGGNNKAPHKMTIKIKAV